MASYRSNASFQESFLKDHKLLADIKCNNGMYLFLHPIEIAAALEIPDEPTEAFRLLGNMYVPLQSGQAWIKIEYLVNPESAYTCMKEVGKLWKISMIDFSVCRIRHVDHVFSVESKSRDDTDECVPTQKFACWKGTSRLVYDASIEDETLHMQMTCQNQLNAP